MNEHPAGSTREVPMFPLGSVLFPYALLPLHVFEPRYRLMVRNLLDGDGEFGVVLIERGSEVGGGDVRFDIGTLARVVQASETPDGRYAIAAVGIRRLHVAQWLPDDPYPRADVVYPSERDGGDAAPAARARAAEEFATLIEAWTVIEPRAAEVELAFDDDPVRASYELAGRAPIGPLDAQRVLAVDDVTERLELLASLLREQTEMVRARHDGPG